ncbi:zinc-ribbon domain-containing protein [Desulfosporosinus sp.]|uniref:zinc-ribbon domain-containing protein n=1 Tax=Desulfosporosinus sp. TaxID=157907 RepID=UPI0025B82D70|nr:zinc-ribbon domain-containing protein [Desulfosporosinus sp.]MBC2726955.1 zinc-ribbon domain-containing protein [Desulfosporosinus sp.]
MFESREIEVKLNPSNFRHYEELGYEMPKVKSKSGKLIVDFNAKIKIKVEDLPDSSNVQINIYCDGCKTLIKNVYWYNYKRYSHNGKYFCKPCGSKLFAGDKIKDTKARNSKSSFYDWCYENLDKEEADDLLQRWDYDLNINRKGKSFSPKNISFKSRFNGKGYWFKCLKNNHEPEQKNIKNFVNRRDFMGCSKCNSFAQYGIDNYGSNFLDKYWDYEKNVVDPWLISRGNTNVSVWIKCQEKNYHKSYETLPSNFTGLNRRCPYCCNRKLHPYDSLGSLYPKVVSLWSDKNEKTPFEVAPHSNIDIWWKCPNGIHEDFTRGINTSNTLDFRCPSCYNASYGEARITSFLLENGFKKVSPKLYDGNFNKKIYIPQKKFNDLLGINNGFLMYDFYIPKCNLLLEFHGRQHEEFTPYFHKSYEDFKIQVEHDKRKLKYAKEKGYKLKIIWYWEYDNIEYILDNYLSDLNQ